MSLIWWRVTTSITNASQIDRTELKCLTKHVPAWVEIHTVEYRINTRNRSGQIFEKMLYNHIIMSSLGNTIQLMLSVSWLQFIYTAMSYGGKLEAIDKLLMHIQH